MKSDTIAAIATALSNSGLGIIRISGEDSITIADRIYRSKSGKKKLSSMPSHTIHYGYIVDHDEVIDEVMVSIMKGPRSYTAENTIEINCHGGIIVMNKVLETVIKKGARLAEPGEFTKRAFLNGRIDLSKAEAVMDIIHSKNQLALKSSVNQLRGFLHDQIKSIRDDIINEIAFIESALDDPEHISLDKYPEKLAEKVEGFIKSLQKLLSSADNGKKIKEGIHTVIVGKPNAGKSSFLNLLAGEERAIVTEIAGTTRDILEETISFDGISLQMIDTAGIRSTEDIVEKIGVERAKKYAQDADLILYVIDSSIALDENDFEIMELVKEKNCIILLNKTDLGDSVLTVDNLENQIEACGFWDSGRKPYMIKTSAKENTGLEELITKIKEMFFHGEISFNDEVFITNQRHKEAIYQALESILLVKESLADGMPEDFYSIDLMSAYSSLGAVIGEEVGEDLVNEIFAKFCMGK